jgi:hypothetical protein
MTRLFILKCSIALAATLALGAAARGETYTLNPNQPCVPGVPCWKPVPSPAGWKCHWSMDIKGKELKSIPVSGPPYGDATSCSLNECAAACDKTAGCVAVDITKSGANKNVCMCTLFGSVTSATLFEEIRAPYSATLSGWACMRLPKSPPPPITENPNFPGTERPALEHDQTRPEAPGTPGTPGRRRP